MTVITRKSRGLIALACLLFAGCSSQSTLTSLTVTLDEALLDSYTADAPGFLTVDYGGGVIYDLAVIDGSSDELVFRDAYLANSCDTVLERDISGLELQTVSAWITTIEGAVAPQAGDPSDQSLVSRKERCEDVDVDLLLEL